MAPNHSPTFTTMPLAPCAPLQRGFAGDPPDRASAHGAGAAPLRSRLPRWASGPGAARVGRTLLAALVAVLAVLWFAQVDKQVELRFDLLTEQDGPVHVFHAGPNGLIDDQAVHTRSTKAHAWQSHAFSINTVRPLSVVRIDPLIQTGQFSLGAMEITGRWGQVRLQGEALQAVISEQHNTRVDRVEADRLYLTATGLDPRFCINFPKSVLRPAIGVLLLWLALAALVSGAVWWLLEHAAHRLKQRQPSLHARLSLSVRRGWLLPLLVCLFATHWAAAQLDDTPITGDGVQNLLMAVNVFRNNTLSLELGAAPAPTNFREPLQPLLVGWYLKVFASAGAAEQKFSAFHSGALVKTVKQVNQLWIFAGLFGVWLIALRAGRNNLVGLAAAALAFKYFFNVGGITNNLYTELATASLIIVCSYTLLRAVQQQSVAWFLGSGAALGLLVLTKAAFFYIGFVAIGLLLLVLWRDHTARQSNFQRVLLCTGGMALGFMLVITPWIVRNEVQFHSARLSSRGEMVLWGRAVMNNMSDEEVLGLMYVKAPSWYKRVVAGTHWAARPGDFEKGGRWQRLNRDHSSFWASDRAAAYGGQPDKAISFHFKGGAEVQRRRNVLTSQGDPYPDQAMGAQFKHEAAQLLKQRPLRHLFMSLPFLWHGFWSLRVSELPWVSVATQNLLGELLNLLAGVALVGVFLRGLWKGQSARVALTVLPVGMMTFYALLSHNIPRYGIPLQPMMLVALVLAVTALWRRMVSRDLRMGRAPSSSHLHS